MTLDYAALESLPVAGDPFAHLVVQNFVPTNDLPAVLAGLPIMRRGGSFPIESLPLRGAARDLAEELRGPRLRETIARRFDLDLGDAATMITLRGQSRAKDGRIHCDSESKRVTVLLYLNMPSSSFLDHQGCLRLLRSSDDLEDFAVEVPPVNGTLLVFPNSPTAWHGHAQYIGPRYVVQLNYMRSDMAAKRELRRHRVSAFLKRMAA